jgi:hypothetical protein
MEDIQFDRRVDIHRQGPSQVIRHGIGEGSSQAINQGPNQGPN